MNNTKHLEVLCAIKRGERATWTRIGTAFPTADGRGFKLKLQYVPMDASSEILVLPPREKDVEGEGH